MSSPVSILMNQPEEPFISKGEALQVNSSAWPTAVSDCVPHETTIQRLKQWLAHKVDSSAVTTVMTIATVYALFGDDVRYASFNKSADDIFFSLATLCLLLFLLELTISFGVKPEYRWGFYFILDSIATLSLIPDIGWVWDPLVGTDDESGGTSDTEQIQNAGKASRAGTRTSRVIRIIRLIRLIRIVKLYKNARNAMKQELDEEDVDQYEIPAESRVGKKLSDLTTKRVIILVLLMLFILPFFEAEFYVDPQHSWDYGLQEVIGHSEGPEFVGIYTRYIDYHKDRDRPLIHFSYRDTGDDIILYSTHDPDKLRYNEKHYSFDDDDVAVAIFDLRTDTELAAILNICKTLFVCVVLTLGALYFTTDATKLVIQPIEKMIDRVKKIARNPISASEDRSITVYDIEVNTKKRCCGLCKQAKVEAAEYEIALIENTINKIGVLLALGFGEAGTSIIGTNMDKGGDVDPMVDGTKIIGIFGFCDIRNFTDTTEELLEGVMFFVNEIAAIVHRTVSKYQGAANKNIGDAFLLVWKFDCTDFEMVDGVLCPNANSTRIKILPDLALLAFLKIIAKINKDPLILKYRTNEKLVKRLPGYSVKMGFGLHVGWAIEGAIGSEFKIDASYLSPHVNIAARLEAATKQFGVPLLVSGEFYDMLSERVKPYLRHIDTVTLKGSKNPMRLYTADIDCSGLESSRSRHFTKEQDLKSRKKLLRALQKGDLQTHELYENCYSLRKMRENVCGEGLRVWDELMNVYIAGDWSAAKGLLKEVLRLQPEDGPGSCLRSIFEDHEYTAPNDWEGYRILNEK